MVQKWTKDADAVLDFTIDWGDWLGTDTISASTWTCDSGITVDSSSNTTTTTTVWLSGGTAGATYTVTNRIVTVAGRTEDRDLQVLILGTVGYCTREDVKNHLPGRDFSEEDTVGRTVVTEADVMFFISTIADEIEALLYRLAFTVPVVLADSPYAYSILGRLNAIGAAALAEEAWSTVKGELSDRAKRLRIQYENMLMAIGDHDINLRDASGGPVLPADLADSGSMDLTSAGGARESYFTREMSW